MVAWFYVINRISDHEWHVEAWTARQGLGGRGVAHGEFATYESASAWRV